MGDKVVKFDDEVYCVTCKEALQYDKPNRQWRTKYVQENQLIYNKCFDKHRMRWEHEPRKNVGRLIRALKRIRDKQRMGLA